MAIRSGALLAGLACLALAAGQAANIWSIPPDARLPVYREVGEWLRQNSGPQDRVGVLETGIIGYYARRPMVDFAGLIEPAVAAQLGPQSDYQAAAIWTAEHFRPAYIVVQAGQMPALEGGFLAENCQEAARFSGAAHGSDFPAQVIYTCK